MQTNIIIGVALFVISIVLDISDSCDEEYVKARQQYIRASNKKLLGRWITLGPTFPLLFISSQFLFRHHLEDFIFQLLGLLLMFVIQAVLVRLILRKPLWGKLSA